MSFNSRARVREYAGGGGGSVGGGILRRTAASSITVASVASNMEARQVDLLVFGYACKVFRDDAKARDIDQGKHLIPWMNDGSLKIDRYDVRGALYDLAPHEPPSGGYGNRLDYLSAEEQRAEQLCEEERYLYLYNNEEELILQQEEDLKRLKQESSSGYSQVAFQYGNDASSASDAGVPHGPTREEFMNSPTCEAEAEQPFALPKNFEVPASIQLPETMKHHAVIEKTARFIASQGVQMEILLKAKQSTNTQFEFLTRNSLLNPYYKFITNAINNGTYPAALMAPLPEAPKEPTIDEAAAELVTRPIVTVVPTIKYKPSANCAYTQLISKIKGLPLPAVLGAAGADGYAASTSAEAKTSGTNSPSALAVTPSDENFMPVLLQYNGNTFVTADDSNSNSNSTSNSIANTNSEVKILKNSSALALAQNYSDSESESSETELEKAAPAPVETAKPKPEPKLHFPIPPESLKNIIDKTATYVIKNGRQFEETLRTKSEERFTFLNADNVYYPYYMYKISGDPDAASKEQKTRKAAAVAAALLSKKGLNIDKTISPVSFSIKVKDEPAPGTQPSVLPQEPSDDENDDGEGTRKSAAAVVGAIDAPAPRSVPENVQKAIQLVESQLMARNAQLAATAGAANGATSLGSGAATATAVTSSSAASRSALNPRSRFDVTATAAAATSTSTSTTASQKASTSSAKSTKAEMERNAQFEQQQQNRQKELKKAEEKVKDKLAQIAREKLGGLISKEKQLQLERKRKAMAFLNQIKGTTSPKNETSSEEQQATTEIKSNGDKIASDDDSDASVHSIPITSYGPEEKTDDEAEQQQQSKVTIKAPSPEIDKAEVAAAAAAAAAAIAIENATVTLSDDDDVQVVSESKAPRSHKPKITPRKRRSRSRHLTLEKSDCTGATHKRQRTHKRHSVSTVYSSSSDYEDNRVTDTYVYTNADASRRSKSRHKSSKSKAKKSSRTLSSSSTTATAAKSKKKSKKQTRSSRSQSPASRRQNRHEGHPSQSPASRRQNRHEGHPSQSPASRRQNRHEGHPSQSHRRSRSRNHRFDEEQEAAALSASSVNSSQERYVRRVPSSSSKRHKSHRSSPPPSALTAKRKERKRNYDR